MSEKENQLMTAICFISLRHLLILGTNCGLDLIQQRDLTGKRETSKAFDSRWDQWESFESRGNSNAWSVFPVDIFYVL